jgi:hypothetical protein
MELATSPSCHMNDYDPGIREKQTCDREAEYANISRVEDKGSWREI